MVGSMYVVKLRASVAWTRAAAKTYPTPNFM